MRPYYRFLKFLCQGFYVLYFRGRVFGLHNVPPTGGVLLACNHQSFFDPVSSALALHREASFMARDTLFRNPLFGRLIASLNAFPVKRGVADIGAVKEILRRLKSGRLVVIFPEATRSPDGLLGRINANALSIAKKAGVTIVPTIVDGAFEAWPRSQLLPSPRATYVTYAAAITPEQVEAWPLEQITETVRRRWEETLAASTARRRATACGQSGTLESS